MCAHQQVDLISNAWILAVVSFRSCCLHCSFGGAATSFVMFSWIFRTKFSGAKCLQAFAFFSSHPFYFSEFRDTLSVARIWFGVLGKVSCLVVSHSIFCPYCCIIFIQLRVRSVKASNAFIGPDGTPNFFSSFSCFATFNHQIVKRCCMVLLLGSPKPNESQMKTITWRWRCVWNCYSWSSFDEIKNDSRPPWKYDESWLQILYFADSCPCSITKDDVSAPNELTVLKIGFELLVQLHCGGLLSLIGWCEVVFPDNNWKSGLS